MARKAKAAPAADLPAWLAAVDGDASFEWARIGWRKGAAYPRAWFDHAYADWVVENWPKWFRLTQDRFAGIPFKLSTWQEIIVRLLVGWRCPDDENLDPATHLPVTYQVRVFRRLLLWVPRKNGKSEFLAALGLLFHIVDAVTDGEGYCFARDEKQARIVLKKMKAMIASNADWATEAITYARSFWLKSTRSNFEMLTGAEDGKHGASATVVVGDEMHEWRSRIIAETLEESVASRLEPIFLYGSTAGPKGNRAGDELWDESVAIRDGQADEPRALVCIYAADPDDDPFDEKVWKKANPNLGISVAPSYLRDRAAKARQSATMLARFCCYHLNIWVDAAVRWFEAKKWDANNTGGKHAWKAFPALLKGRACWGGVDNSATQDVTALIWLFPPTAEDPKWRIICRFWVPADTMAQRIHDDRVPYNKFVDAGALETTPGDAVDQDYIKEAILAGGRDFDVQGIGLDPWNALKLKTDLEKAGHDPALIQDVRQGIQTLGEPSKHIERLYLARQLDHGGNPMLRWMALNCVVRFDENMNFAPAKKRSREKIDGIVALVTAGAPAFDGEEPADLDDFLKAGAMYA